MARAEEIEAEATQRAIVLANQARCPLGITPVTSKSSAKAISEAKRRGKNVIVALKVVSYWVSLLSCLLCVVHAWKCLSMF